MLFLRLPQRFQAPAGVREQGGQELQLQAKVARGGTAGEVKGINARLELHTDIFTGEQPAQFIRAMLAQTAGA